MIVVDDVAPIALKVIVGALDCPPFMPIVVASTFAAVSFGAVSFGAFDSSSGVEGYCLFLR